jgi:hypothetical protein
MGSDSTVKIVAAVLLVVVLAILFLRRKGKKPKTEDEDFGDSGGWSEAVDALCDRPPGLSPSDVRGAGNRLAYADPMRSG